MVTAAAWRFSALNRDFTDFKSVASAVGLKRQSLTSTTHNLGAGHVGCNRGMSAVHVQHQTKVRASAGHNPTLIFSASVTRS